MKKSFDKVWQMTDRDLHIRVENTWNFRDCEETIRINGKTVFHRRTPLDDAPASLGLHKVFYENGRKITVKLGSAWHGCAVACRISVDDRYVVGNRIVLFAGKAA